VSPTHSVDCGTHDLRFSRLCNIHLFDDAPLSRHQDSIGQSKNFRQIRGDDDNGDTVVGQLVMNRWISTVDE
jgi:hypothetical protein